MISKIKYEFSAKPWKYASPNAWYFVSLPVDLAHEIRAGFKWQEEAWGRLKATAIIGNSEWETAIWYDTKMQTYLLPLKAAIRKKEKIDPAKAIHIVLWI